MNDKLLELKRKKLQQQILYLRTELEETELIFQDCLRGFDVEFRKYFKNFQEINMILYSYIGVQKIFKMLRDIIWIIIK